MQVFSIKPPVYFFLLLSIVILGFFSNMAENAYSVYLIALPILYICLHAFILELIVSAKELWTKQKLHFLFLSLKNLVLCLFMISAVGKLVNIGIFDSLFVISTLCLFILLLVSIPIWIGLFFLKRVSYSKNNRTFFIDLFQLLLLVELIAELTNLVDMSSWRIYPIALFFLVNLIQLLKEVLIKKQTALSFLHKSYSYNLKSVFFLGSIIPIIYLQLVSLRIFPVFFWPEKTLAEIYFDKTADIEKTITLKVNSKLFWGIKNHNLLGLNLSKESYNRLQQGFIVSNNGSLELNFHSENGLITPVIDYKSQ